MTTTDPQPIYRLAAGDARTAISDMIDGLEELYAWLDDYPACARVSSHPLRVDPYLVYCMTPDEFADRATDLADEAPVGAITNRTDDRFVRVHRSFGGGVSAEVYAPRRDGEVAS